MTTKTLHPDAAAVDRIGADKIQAHFNITRQAVAYWRRHGVPNRHRKSLAILGTIAGIDLPEMREEKP